MNTAITLNDRTLDRNIDSVRWGKISQRLMSSSKLLDQMAVDTREQLKALSDEQAEDGATD